MGRIVNRLVLFRAALARELQFAGWSLRIGWRIGCGRWYVMRDAPMWVVIRLVAHRDDQISGAAADEVALRLMQMERRLHLAIKKTESMEPQP
jgi:hypothetical protein